MKIFALVALLGVTACSGNYPHTTLPKFWPGNHMQAGQYANQDCVVGGPMAYGMDAQKRALGCTKTAALEWFR